jgi:hypothetical protein
MSDKILNNQKSPEICMNEFIEAFIKQSLINKKNNLDKKSNFIKRIKLKDRS